MKPNFTVALIAKNEEKTLPRLLNSLKEFKERDGEILLLDTGSTDNTAKIARDFGCKVYEVNDMFIRVIDNADEINNHFIIQGESPIIKNGDKLFDFASARNYIAQFASNDMLATPDCDEIYTKLDLDKICKCIEDGAEQLEYNFVFSHDEYGNEAIKFTHCKFYNRTKLKWQGIIHEVLVGNAQRTFLDESIIKLEHFQNHGTNRSGYLRGLALDCFNNPDNDRNSHYFARELMWTNRFKSAIKEFERHISMNAWVTEKAQSMIFIGDCYSAMGVIDKAVQFYNQAIFTDNTRREALIKLARLYKYLNNPRMVAVYVSAAMEIPWSPFYANDYSHYSNEPHELMYWAKGWLGDIDSAKYHILQAFKYKPGNLDYLRDIKIYFGLPYVSIIIPQLGRPEGLQETLDSIDALNYPKELIQTIIVEGPETVPIKVSKGVQQSYGEYIVYASNDMTFTPDSLRIAIQEGIQNNKGLIAFDTGVRNADGYICEHFVLRKNLLFNIKEIFDTEFHHVGVDDLLWHKCTKLNESMISTAKVNHKHFSRLDSNIPKDDVILKGWEFAEQDRELLKKKLGELYGQ